MLSLTKYFLFAFLIQGVPASDDEDEVDNKTYIKEAEQKLKKEQDELSKIDTGIAKVFLQDREKDRENLRHRAANVDPRNASRTPSAAREPTYRLRYESPVGACKLTSLISLHLRNALMSGLSNKIFSEILESKRSNEHDKLNFRYINE